MSDVVISYARSTTAQANAVAEALRSLGYYVWRDDQLPAHRAYTEVIEEQLESARAVVVVWSAEAARSQWVQSEADRARHAGKLVQLRLDDVRLPMPFDRVQCADMTDWTGDLAAPGWRISGGRDCRRAHRGPRLAVIAERSRGGRFAGIRSACCRSPT